MSVLTADVEMMAADYQRVNVFLSLWCTRAVCMFSGDGRRQIHASALTS